MNSIEYYNKGLLKPCYCCHHNEALGSTPQEYMIDNCNSQHAFKYRVNKLAASKNDPQYHSQDKVNILALFYFRYRKLRFRIGEI